MKNIILSIKPYFVEAILDGKKTIELRKRVGKLFIENNTVYIYSTSPVKAIVAEAKISHIDRICPSEIRNDILISAHVSKVYFDDYFKKSTQAYLIHLKDIRRLKHPINIDILRQLGVTPPQSFCYSESERFTKKEGL
ncbi:hypothetical protein D3C84_722950 [compost metagenome]